jgi:hypothetical protein
MPQDYTLIPLKTAKNLKKAGGNKMIADEQLNTPVILGNY